MTGIWRFGSTVWNMFGFALQIVLLILISTYRLLISPLFPPSCRYKPSCSGYALEAVRRFGAIRGGWLAIRRLSRCHPWGDYGYDPVPEEWSARSSSGLKRERI